MQLLHRCDIFRVVQDQENHLSPATPYGAAVSMGTLLLLFLLLLGECTSYFSGHENCHITPSTFTNTLDSTARREVERLRFSISLPFMPCHRIAVETISAWGHEAEVERDTVVHLYHIPLGSFAENTSVAYMQGELPPTRGEGCLVRGTTPLSGKPASFNIILKDYRFDDSRTYRPAFRVHQFVAGISYADWGVSQIRRETLEPMAGWENDAQSFTPHLYHFFVQFIPTTVDRPGQDDRFGYQYAAFSSMLRYDGRGQAPGLYFSYRRSPFAMDCAVQYDTVSHFVVNLCAVVGGVYTVAGMVKAALEWGARQRRLREASERNRQNAQEMKSATVG